MKVKTILICLSFAIGLLIASCTASKTCPAYSNSAADDTVEVTG